jgi:serine/threonine protein kinase
VVEELLLATDSFKVSVASTMSRCDLAADSEKPAAACGLPSTSSRYRYIKLLGRGGFGEVWRAHDELLGRDVALKGPRRDRNFSQRALAAFIEEARKGSQLRQMCERVVNVLDIEDEGGFCFIVMELMQGGSLANRIKAGPVPLAEAAGTVAEIAEVLARLHSRDYVHRDIKPANVLFDESGNPYLADLGLAASAEDLLDEPDVALGTLLYMPLEQAESRSNQVDGRADIYSLGVLFYQLLTGRLPHLARTRPEYIKRLKDPDG